MSAMERFLVFKKIAISLIKNVESIAIIIKIFFLILNQTKLSHGLQFI